MLTRFVRRAFSFWSCSWGLGSSSEVVVLLALQLAALVRFCISLLNNGIFRFRKSAKGDVLVQGNITPFRGL